MLHLDSFRFIAEKVVQERFLKDAQSTPAALELSERVQRVKPGSKHEVCPCGGAAKTAACSRGPEQIRHHVCHVSSH